MSQYHRFLKDWTTERNITSFLGSDKSEFQKDWKEEKKPKTRFGEKIVTEPMEIAEPTVSEKVSPKITIAPPKAKSLTRTERVTIDGVDYLVKGDKIARAQTGLVIKDKKLVERLFKKMEKFGKNTEKKPRELTKKQQEKARAEARASFERMRLDKAQGGTY